MKYYSDLVKRYPQVDHDPITRCDLLMMHAATIESGYQPFIDGYKEALEVIRPLKDYTRIARIYWGICQKHSKYQKYSDALLYNDSTIAACYQAMAAQNDNLYVLASAYQNRAMIYTRTGQGDSAAFYMRRAHAQEIYFMRQQESERVAEVEARYKSEQKSLQIRQLYQKLRIIIGIISLILFFGAILAYYYVQLRRAKIKTEQMADQLRSLDAAKSRFFANVSHELRTPLTLLTSPIHTLLKENQLTEKQIRLLQMAGRSGRQLEQLVNEILDLRKLEMGKMSVQEKPTALWAYFTTYFAQFESLASRRQVDFSVELAIPEQVVAGIDREKCRQILFNLLSNAFKFTPAGGQIRAKVTFENERLQLVVSDTGPGIHPDDLPHLFDRFFQTNRPDKPAEGGTGIGLALCQEYAQLFGGTVRVESTFGHGAVFTVGFPAKIMAAADETAFAPLAEYGHLIHDEAAHSLLPHASKPDPATRPTLLLVEDNLDLRDYIRFILQKKYHIVTAENGREALKWLKVDGKRETGDDLPDNQPFNHSPIQPSLILSDLMMPVMDGYQLLEHLKSDDTTRHIPFIMLTARAEAQDRLKALRIGVDDYLTKPFDEEELLVRIENLLRNQAVRRQEVAATTTRQEASQPFMSQPDCAWLETFEAYIQKHYSNNVLSVAFLASEFAMSESTLLRQLKRLTGLSPLQYIQEVRLDKARRLIEDRACNSIAQVASKVGYDDARTFARGFKQRFGKLPSEMMVA